MQITQEAAQAALKKSLGPEAQTPEPQTPESQTCIVKLEEDADPDLVTWEGPDDVENPKNWAFTVRWWLTIIASAFSFILPVSTAATIVTALFFRETFAPALLARKAARMRKETGNPDLHTKWQKPDRIFTKLALGAIARPFMLLTTQPILQVFALYIAYVFGLTYLALSTFPILWTTQYGMSISIAGLNYLALAISYILDTGIAIFGAGVKFALQCTQLYALDVYPSYAASASAASMFVRSLAGFAFPLFAPYLYLSPHFGWGNTLLALIALVLGVPAPFILWYFGPSLRRRSPYAAG
ncbi:hypothetical protein DL771_010405 [Monosporascus sp. 5C6A]|nr:hypothetical protein DL771_010405 [Monosporascus sp. 5C6A]